MKQSLPCALLLTATLGVAVAKSQTTPTVVSAAKESIMSSHSYRFDYTLPEPN